jgi:glycosyltransferase involved in cell wall biosynthesis
MSREDRELRAFFIILNREAASSRYRCLQYIPFLESAGIVPDVLEVTKGIRERISGFSRLKHFNLVFIQKKLFSLPNWVYLRSKSQRIVFDFDDAIIYRDSRRGTGLSKTRLRRFSRIAKGSELVIAGNTYLGEIAKGFAPRVLMIPTPIDMNRYTERKPIPSKTIRIGWIGSASTLFYLEKLYPVLRELCRSRKDIQVKVVSDQFPDWHDVPLERKPWLYEEEIQDLHSFDIGIMPLTDDPWAKGKCGFKLLQYMAVGSPVVCSPVGMNAELVQDGMNGLLARNPEEWAKCLRFLIEDPDQGLRLGRAGRKTVIERYGLDLWAKRLVSALKELIEFQDQALHLAS